MGNSTEPDKKLLRIDKSSIQRVDFHRSLANTLGADVVVQSVTKFIGGHSDLLGGVIPAWRATQPTRPRANCTDAFILETRNATAEIFSIVSVTRSRYVRRMEVLYRGGQSAFSSLRGQRYAIGDSQPREG